jgi:hypothetical protein
MLCKHCGCSFRLTKFHKDKQSCLDCDGITDDLTIDDAELQIDVWKLKNPSGRTPACIVEDFEE